MDYYIYLLRDPRDQSIRYCGATNDLRQRLLNHTSRRTGNAPVRHWIEELRTLGLRPIMQKLDCLTSDTAAAPDGINELEQLWIAHLATFCPALLNIKSNPKRAQEPTI